MSDEEAVQIMRYGDASTEFPDCTHCRHALCHQQWCARRAGETTDHSGMLDLSLLQTCSQMHREAALVPFRHNIFAVNSVQELYFLDSLAHTQLLSIKSVSSHTVGMYLPFPVKEYFPGVTSFTAIIKLHADVMCIDDIIEADEEDIREQLYSEFDGSDSESDSEDEEDESELSRKAYGAYRAQDHVRSLTVCLVPERDSLIWDLPTVALVSRKVEQAMQRDCPRCRLVKLGEQVPEAVAAGCICHYVVRRHG